MPPSDPASDRKELIQPPKRRFWPRLVMPAAALAALAFLVGFFTFANGLPRNEIELSGSADGIVVLTGGASRIVDAVELLAANRGRRLLISGVNPTTTHGELIRKNPEFERLFVGRIDLGHAAMNTIGNAAETGNWVRAQKFRSLIVVTSGWHMPRALVEIAHELPDVKLIAYPVVSDRMREQPWWSDSNTIRLLLIEYTKYLASLLRVRLEPAAQVHTPS
jgi:uncharacterized SAM-binding protein YcdF (DUF218 family)